MIDAVIKHFVPTIWKKIQRLSAFIMMNTDSLCSSCSEITEAMSRQSAEYAVSDYFADALSELRQQDLSEMAVQAFLDDAVDCRHKMIQWMSQVVAYCDFSTETTEIAINCLDRFIASSPDIRRSLLGKHNSKSEFNQRRQEYQLVAVACLYTVVKVHEPQCLSPTSLANLGKGLYEPCELEWMELRILNALNWRVHLPTTSACIRQLVADLQCFDESLVETCVDLARRQVELAWGEHKYPAGIYTLSSMTLATAAVQNALESLGFTLSSPLTDTALEAAQETSLLLLAADSHPGKLTTERSNLVYSPVTVISSHEDTTVNSEYFRNTPRSAIVV
jgi:Cyclin, N-terminal domain